MSWNKNHFLIGLFFYCLLAFTYVVYSQGIGNGFIFDDFPNLEPLASDGSVNDWASFKNFVLNGHSGPLGRPISLASFLIDDNTWPSKAAGFKQTNIKIHLLCGLALWVLLFNLFMILKYTELKSMLYASMAAGLWLLHPINVSTTLYVVQRMAQLSTLFIFIGLGWYLYGRRLLVNGVGREIAAYVHMSFSIGICTPLAILSKENGILLPLFILAFELSTRGRLDSINRYWALFFLGIPFLAFSYLMWKEINLSDWPWSNRNFNQKERVLTEARIIWDYIWHIITPSFEGKGLFNDGFLLSRGVFHPWTTMVAVVSLLVLASFAWMLRTRHILISLGILLFLISHLLESTHLGLELYFEHRNYLGAGFCVLLFVSLLDFVWNKFNLRFAATAGGLIILIFSVFTFQRVLLWKDTIKLETFWGLAAPESPRAQNKLVSIYLRSGQKQKAFDHLSASLEKFPESSLILFNYLMIRVDHQIATHDDFLRAYNIAKSQRFDAQSIMGSTNLTDVCLAHKDRVDYIDFTISFFENLQADSLIKNNPQFLKVSYYSLGRLFLAKKDHDAAFFWFEKAIEKLNNLDSGMSIVAIMANYGRPIEARMLLHQLETLRSIRPKMIRTRSDQFYDAEMARMKSILAGDLEDIGISNINFTKPEKK